MASAVSLETGWAEAGEDESFKELHDAIANGKVQKFNAENAGLSQGKLQQPKFNVQSDIFIQFIDISLYYLKCINVFTSACEKMGRAHQMRARANRNFEFPAGKERRREY